jgi:hypothetical protein
MGPRTRTIVGLLLLLLAAGHLAGAALHSAPCEDDCEASCGDCASCPLLASLTSSLTVTPCPASGEPLSTTASPPLSSAARAIEHVPLDPRA